MSVLSSLMDAPPPSAAIEIAADRISGVSVDFRGGRAVVTAHAFEPIAPGAVLPSLASANIHDTRAIAAALKRILDEIGRPRRIGLVLPDSIAKVSIVRFEKTPPRATDLDQLVRWQVRKAAPFPIEEAQVSFVPGLRVPPRADDAGGQDFIVTVARRDVIEEYEKVCADAGAHAGVVDISTFNVINMALASSRRDTSGDWLLINAAGDAASIAIVRNGHVIFFRTRGHGSVDSEGTLPDLVHQTAMYHEDRLGGAGFTRILIAGLTDMQTPDGASDDAVWRTLAGRLRGPLEPIDPRTAVMVAQPGSLDAAPVDRLAPVIGLLLRDRARVSAA